MPIETLYSLFVALLRFDCWFCFVFICCLLALRLLFVVYLVYLFAYLVLGCLWLLLVTIVTYLVLSLIVLFGYLYVDVLLDLQFVLSVWRLGVGLLVDYLCCVDSCLCLIFLVVYVVDIGLLLL